MSALRPLLRGRLPTVARQYVTRAHPKPIERVPIGAAIGQVLEGVEARKAKRLERWEKHGDSLARRRGAKNEGPYRQQDESIEIALNLNLDPRKPGQALRGSVSLPHGSGKANRVVVFTSDEELARAAVEGGAAAAGGTDLIADIASGAVPVAYDRALATPEAMPSLGKVARLLGPRGLMPNAKVGTIQPPDQLLAAVRDQVGGMVQYRTDRAGIVHAGVAKASFGEERIADNVRAFMNAIQDAKPENFGKGKKKGVAGAKGGKKGGTGGGAKAKFYLGAAVSSSQGRGVPVDLSTVDPTSNWFMSVPEE